MGSTVAVARAAIAKQSPVCSRQTLPPKRPSSCHHGFRSPCSIQSSLYNTSLLRSSLKMCVLHLQQQFYACYVGQLPWHALYRTFPITNVSLASTVNRGWRWAGQGRCVDVARCIAHPPSCSVNAPSESGWLRRVTGALTTLLRTVGESEVGLVISEPSYLRRSLCRHLSRRLRTHKLYRVSRRGSAMWMRTRACQR